MASKSLTLADATLVAAAVVAIAGGAVGAGRALRRVYRHTIGSRRDLAQRLNQAAAGVTSDYIEARFGPPAFRRDFQWAGKPTEPPVRELIYRAKHAWLQTLLGANNAVVRFSITVTDRAIRCHAATPDTPSKASAYSIRNRSSTHW